MLKDLYINPSLRETLNIWDMQLVSFGSKIIERRIKFVEQLNEIICDIHKNLSGGNYWGRPTSNGISKSLKEIFQNYQSGYEHGNIRNTLTKSIPQLCTEYNYFRLFNLP